MEKGSSMFKVAKTEAAAVKKRNVWLCRGWGTWRGGKTLPIEI